MKKALMILGLIYCCIIYFISCDSKSIIYNNKNVTSIDSVNIEDSLRRERQSLTCDTPYQSVDIVIIKDETDEEDYSMSFFSQIDEKGNVLSGGKPIDTSTNIFEPYAKPTNKISQKALYHLAAYIDKNCECKHPIGNKDSIIYGGYVFRLIQGDRTKICYVFSPDTHIKANYLNGLKKWLEDSKYKQEFKKLISYIDYSIKLNK